MHNSWRFLLILVILSKIFDLPFPLNLAVFLYFYYMKDTGDSGWLSFYHEAKSSFLISNVPTSEESWKDRYFYMSGNWD